MHKMSLFLVLLLSMTPLQACRNFIGNPHPVAAPTKVVSAVNLQNMRVEPANWWIGLIHNEVEIMFHYPGIRDREVTIDGYTGVKITQTHKLQSPNYLIVAMQILPKAQPGEILFRFKGPTDELTHAYPIKLRTTSPKAQGITSKDAIYLVFPDRFANGDTSNDQVAGMAQGHQRDSLLGRHGGDLKGITNHLDYIQDLGMTAVWLNPELENDQDHESYHGYALTDHYRVDRRLGDNQALLELSSAVHARGMKLIRDVVFNHIGIGHYWMKDLPDPNWINQWPEFTRTTYRAPTLVDPYASEQDKKQFTDGWFDTRMPDLNQRHPRLAQYLLQQTIWWVEYAGFDDYRIDTYTYSDQKFMSWWCTQMRREYPLMQMFGEIWDHGVAIQGFFADDQPQLRAHYDSNLPGVIDFQVAFAIHEMLTKEQGWTEGAAKLYYVLAQDHFYKDPSKNVLFLDNHDFTRFYSIVEEKLSKYKSGVAMLATLRGTPQVYYATEILGTGRDWPSHGNIRKDFPGGWPGDQVNKFEAKGRTPDEQEAFNYLRNLFQYRKKSTALQSGKCTQFVPINGLYVYFRYDEASTVMVAINTSAKEQKLDINRFAERIQSAQKGKDIATGATVSLANLVVPANAPIIIELEK
jgi:neopullulanase